MDFAFLVLTELNSINVHEDVVKIELEKTWLFVRSHNKRIAEENDKPADDAKACNIKLLKLVTHISLSYVLVLHCLQSSLVSLTRLYCYHWPSEGL